MTNARRFGAAGFAIVAMAFLWLLARPTEQLRASTVAREQAPEPEKATTTPVEKPATAVPIAPSEAARPALPPTRSAGGMPLTTMPKSGTRARKRVWVRSSYGKGEDQLGRSDDAETRPPQGFVPTRDGKLLVLDSAKMRLVTYDENGKVERKLALPESSLVMPADVSITKDGTVVVIDHLGVQTKGIVMLDENGKLKAELPQQREAAMSGMYTVGNDIFATVDGMSTLKLGDSSGSASDETPGILRQEGSNLIAGHVAPDGKTVLSAGFTDRDAGQFFVNAMQGVPGEEIFTRFYDAPGVSGLMYLQADGDGKIYIVLNSYAHFELVCLDGKTGAPVGSVSLPFPPGESGTQFRMFNVVESGGLVVQVAGAKGVSYEWFDCH